MKNLKGFTLAEILIAMLVLGIIVAASVPIILNLTPNKNAIMMKKAYYATESIVHSLINDPNYYPDLFFNCINSNGTLKNSATDNCYYGFDYAASAIYIPELGATAVPTTRKLQCLFASKLNIKENLADVCKTTTGYIDVVNTMDGITWNLSGLSNASADGTIEIDVDGINKGVSAYNGTTLKACANSSTWGTSCNSDLTNAKKNKFDRIQITISKDGKLSIAGGQDELKKIISGETKLIGDDDEE